MRSFWSSLCYIFCFFCFTHMAYAIEPVRVSKEALSIDLSQVVERYETKGDRLQVSAAPGADGVVRRIEVSAKGSGTQPSWIVFALTNDTEEAVERLIVVPHFRLIGSGILWPDMGGSRLSAITSSQGLSPVREESHDADIFRLKLEPGATVTYVAELKDPHLPNITLWTLDAYKEKNASLTLYQGIVIGISGLLVLFLSILFVVKGAIIFPAAAALAWAVLIYVCIDFGFWDKILDLQESGSQIWRAISETTIAATLLLFLFAYLNLNRWHVRASWWALGSFLFLGVLILLSAYQPSVAAGVARISIAAIALIGFILILYLSTHRYDRAVMLIPAWFMLFLWVCAAGFTVTGVLTNDLVAPALVGGLVLIVMLIGFTIMQNAFTAGIFLHGSVSENQRRMLASLGAGDSIFDWDAQVDNIYVSPEIEQVLGFKRGRLQGPASSWLELLHPQDREVYSLCLDTVFERRCGYICTDFRLRAAEEHYIWLRLKARPVVGEDGEVLRVLGTIADVTHEKISDERLLQDAVYDTLTGLPNRRLCLDRLEQQLLFSQKQLNLKPTFIGVDIDQFRHVNQAYHMSVGDMVLLTLARRLSRLLKPQDTLARMEGDFFGIIFLSSRPAEEIAPLTHAIRHAMTRPLVSNTQEITLTASIGVVLYDPQRHAQAEDLLKEAEVTVEYIKRSGGNGIEIFRPGMRTQRPDPISLQADLRHALERNEMQISYQPIVRLEDQTIAGFQAMLHWNHPRLGRLSMDDFSKISHKMGYDIDISLMMMGKVAQELAIWQRALDVEPPIFTIVELPSPRLLRYDLLKELGTILSKSHILPGTFKLQISEHFMRHNFEQSVRLLQEAKSIGASLILGNFGTECSLADYMRRFPFEMICVKKSLIHHISPQGIKSKYERSISLIGQELGTQVMVDGLESEQEAQRLSQLGYIFGQGSQFSPPMTPAQAYRLIGT